MVNGSRLLICSGSLPLTLRISFIFEAYSTWVFAFALLGEILGGILSALLVWGAVKKRRNFLLPWLIYAVIVMVGAVVCIIVCVVILPISYGIAFLIIGILELRKYFSIYKTELYGMRVENSED